MADNEKTTLATFNVGSEDWESFKALAKKDGRPASYYLNQFIRQSISRGSFENVGSDVKPISDIDLTDVETAMTEKINQAIAALRGEVMGKDGLESLKVEIENLRGEVEQIKKDEPVS
ncbi:MAG: hypothetical protein ACKO2V_05535 [Snowella sp.]